MNNNNNPGKALKIVSHSDTALEISNRLHHLCHSISSFPTEKEAIEWDERERGRKNRVKQKRIIKKDEKKIAAEKKEGSKKAK